MGYGQHGFGPEIILDKSRETFLRTWNKFGINLLREKGLFRLDSEELIGITNKSGHKSVRHGD